jgi:hypothetical protein
MLPIYNELTKNDFLKNDKKYTEEYIPPFINFISLFILQRRV